MSVKRSYKKKNMQNVKGLIIGLVFGLFLIVILSSITHFVLAQDVVNGTDLGLNYVANESGLGTADLRVVVARIIQVFMGVLAIIAIVLIIYGGFLWMTAAGNEERVGKAKKVLISAIIGLAIVIFAFAIVSFVIRGLTGATGGGGGETPTCIGSQCYGGGLPGCVEPQGNENPYICTISPRQGPEGQNVVISGYKFGDFDKEKSKVYFGDKEAEIIFCNTSSQYQWLYKPSTGSYRIVAKVPQGILAEGQDEKDVTVKVVSQDGKESTGLASNQFTVNRNALGPNINCIVPDEGTEGTPITIEGERFGTTKEETSNAYFPGEKVCAIKESVDWTDTNINTTVPADTSSGDVVVTVSASSSSGYYFGVVCQTNDNCTSQCCWGADSTKNISGFCAEKYYCDELVKTFYVDNFSPKGSVPIRNVIPKIYFNQSVSQDQADANISIIKSSDNSKVAGKFDISGIRVKFIPEATCPEPNQDLHCLEADTDYSIQVSDQMTSAQNNSIICSDIHPCVSSFKTGNLIDSTAPTVNITYPLNGGWICKPSDIITSTATDDAGIADISYFYDNDYSIGTDVLNAQGGSGWPYSDWKYRKQILIDHTKVSNVDQTNFPVLIQFSSDSDLKSNAQANGNDIFFTSADGITKLSYEMENYDANTGALTAWVKLPTLSISADSKIYMYYGNSSATSQQNSTAVWNSEYKGVWHMKNSDNTHIGDSTSNNYSGTISGGVAVNTSSKIGYGQTFDGNNGSMATVSNASAISDTNLSSKPNVTVSTWIYYQGKKSYNQNFIGKASSSNGWMLSLNTNNTRISFSAFGTDSCLLVDSSDINMNQWYYATVTMDSGTCNLYVNGTKVATDTYSGLTDWNSAVNIGGRNTVSQFIGTIDETRFSLATYSADRIKTEFNNQSDPASFVKVSQKEQPTSNGISFNSSILWDVSSLENSSQHMIKAVASDFDEHTSESSSVRVNVLTEHCCNNNKDADELGVDCGGSDCPACDGADCDTSDKDAKTCATPTDSMCRSLFCNPSTCKCKDLPRIDGIWPSADGAVGNLISIWGINFGDKKGKITFLGNIDDSQDDKVALFASSVNSECKDYWADDLIVVAIPFDAADGPIRIDTGETPSFYDTTINDRGPQILFDVNNKVRPGLCNINPESGIFGSPFNVSGINFKGADRNIYFGADNRIAAIGSSFDSEIKGSATVPNVSRGRNLINVGIDGEYSNSLNFMIGSLLGSELRIDYLNPERGAKGQYVTIFGAGFGKQAEGNKVEFISSSGESVTADIDFPAQCAKDWWHDTYIVVKVPSIDVGSNDVKVTRNDGQTSNAKVFTVTLDPLTPGLCALSPNNGPAGNKIDLIGERLGAGTDSLVKFYPINTTGNDINKWDEWKDQRIKGVEVPGTAKTGPVKVSVNGVLSNGINFEVGTCTPKTDTTPGSCSTGYDCCQEGNLKGSCMLQGLCAVEAPACTYAWAFSTGMLIKPIPRVIDTCQCSESLQSPSPRAIQPDGSCATSEDFCLNGAISARFTTDMNNDSLLKDENITVRPCQDSDCTVMGGDTIGRVSIYQYNNADGFTEEGFIFYPSQELYKNTWYQVRLYGGENGIKSAFNIPLKDDYIWKFKTSSQACKVTKAKVTPTIAVLNNSLYDDITRGLKYTQIYSATALTAQCYIVSGVQWDWSLEKYPNSPAAFDAFYSSVNQESEKVYALSEGTDYVVAQSLNTNPIVSNKGQVVIDFGRIKIISHRPSCDSACMNAEISATFNTPLKESTFTGPQGNRVRLYKCESNDELCLVSKATEVSAQVLFSPSGNPIKVKLNPLGSMVPGVYRVILDDGIGDGQGGTIELNYDRDGVDGNDSYTWTFVVASDVACLPDHTKVNPATVFMTGGLQDLYSEVFSAPDNCDSLGQALNPEGYDWDWKIDNTEVVDFASDASSSDGNQTIRALTKGKTIATANVIYDKNASQETTVLEEKRKPSQITVEFNNLLVVDYWPNCNNACVNAAVGARFNMPIVPETIKPNGQNLGDNIKLYNCPDNNCNKELKDLKPVEIFDAYQVAGNRLYLKLADNKEFTDESGNIKPGKYKAVFLGGNSGLMGEGGKLFAGLNYDINNDNKNEAFTWEFVVENIKCKLFKAAIDPEYSKLYSINARKVLQVLAYSAPDLCSAEGQILNAESYAWSWQSIDPEKVLLENTIIKWINKKTNEVYTSPAPINYKTAVAKKYDLAGGRCANDEAKTCSVPSDCSTDKVCQKDLTKTCTTHDDCGKVCSNDNSRTCSTSVDCKVCSNLTSQFCTDDTNCAEGGKCIYSGTCSLADRCDYKYDCLNPNTTEVDTKANNEDSQEVKATGYATVVCGFETDQQCIDNNDENFGLGKDTCCYARPLVSSTYPSDSQDSICRNTAMVVNFDQEIDSATLASNMVFQANYKDLPCSSAVIYKTYNSIAAEWSKNLSDLAVDKDTGKIKLAAGKTSGSWTVTYDSTLSNQLWRKIYWDGYVPSNTEIKARARSSSAIDGSGNLTNPTEWTEFSSQKSIDISNLAHGQYLQLEIQINKTESVSAEITPLLDYATIESGGLPPTAQSIIQRTIQFVKNIIMAPIRWIAGVFGINAWAQTDNWCVIGITPSGENVSDYNSSNQLVGSHTKVSIAPSAVLDASREYRMILLGQNTDNSQVGITAKTGVKMRSDYTFKFRTSADICKIDSLETMINGMPATDDIFSCAKDNCPDDQTDITAGNQHLYEVAVKDQHGQYLQSLPGATISYRWQESDPKMAIGLIDSAADPLPSNKSCDALEVLTGDSRPTSIYTSGCFKENESAAVNITAFDGALDAFDLGSASQTINITVSMCYTPWNWQEQPYTFGTNYCRDIGELENAGDDLPILDIVPVQ